MTSNTDSPVAFSPALPRILGAQGWQRTDLLDSVDSTNTYAVAAAQPWHVVAAHEQSAGRGRLARTWQVPPGASVAMSVTMPLPREGSTWGWVPLFVGAVVLESCAARWPEGEFALKWPNDVLARETSGPRVGEWSKVAGILCQVVAGSTPLVVVGVGLNVSQDRDELPVENATSLHLLGASASRDEMIGELGQRLHELGRTWADEEALAALRRRVRDRCSTIGADVVVHTASGDAVATRAVGIDDDGRLMTRVPGRNTGEPRSVMADTVTYSVADIEHVRPATGTP